MPENTSSKMPRTTVAAPATVSVQMDETYGPGGKYGAWTTAGEAAEVEAPKPLATDGKGDADANDADA